MMKLKLGEQIRKTVSGTQKMSQGLVPNLLEPRDHALKCDAHCLLGCSPFSVKWSWGDQHCVLPSDSFFSNKTIWGAHIYTKKKQFLVYFLAPVYYLYIFVYTHVFINACLLFIIKALKYFSRREVFLKDNSFSMDKLIFPLTIREDWKRSNRIFLFQNGITSVIW